MLDFRINTFLCVCKYMNFTKAALELNLTQPAVSQHIHYLEKLYQCKLFTYAGKKLSLTPAGTELFYAATALKHDSDFLMDKLHNFSEQKQTLIFGATLTIGEFILPEKLIKYRKTHPYTDVQMVIQNTHVLLELLQNNQIDFAIIEGYFSKKEYESLIYSTENYTAVCSHDYFFHKKPLSIQDLYEEPLLLRENGSGTREILERYLTEKNSSIHDFSHIIEVNSIHVLKKLAISGAGITFLYESAVKEELSSGILKKVPLNSKHFSIFHDFTFIWRKNSIYKEHYYKMFEAFR